MLRALLFSLLLVSALTQAQAQTQPRIAIIIDDIGYHRLRGEAIARLPGAITYAVIPQTPHGPALARLAHAEANGRPELEPLRVWGTVINELYLAWRISPAW